jgi:hypothetical protein
MKFTIDNREYKDYELSNKQLLELVRSENTTSEEKEFLTSKIIDRFSYDLCPKAGENEDDVFVRFFSNFVNGKLTSVKDVADKMAQEHRYLQQEMFKVCLAYIENLAHKFNAGYDDGRNAYACGTSSKIIKALDDLNVPY